MPEPITTFPVAERLGLGSLKEGARSAHARVRFQGPLGSVSNEPRRFSMEFYEHA